MHMVAANREISLLHPVMRTKAVEVLSAIDAAGLPLKIFEAWRSPERQTYLFAQGRTQPGNIVTKSRAWESYHQYGLAIDVVGFVDGNWTWDLPAEVWTKMHQIGAGHGLEWLNFETPHLQLAGLDIHDLMQGSWPVGGDDAWRANVTAAIAGRSGSPAAPPSPTDSVDRPGLADVSGVTGLDWSKTPAPTRSDWHSQFGGQSWRHDASGIYLQAAPNTPLRTPGPPSTCSAILERYGPSIHRAAVDHGIAPELIVMTIATETSFAVKTGFTGPRTFRWEPHVEVTDVNPHTFGDYSAGPMQTLATTAREVISKLNLTYPDPFAVAPYFQTQPDPPPAAHPLYDGAANIDIGTAESRTRLPKTGLDPIFVAAAFNAGGLYPNGGNAWHLRSYGDHLDRAAAWYGDACLILSALR